jgi:glycosyltransferase involved in cell wall biosynthesis
MTQPQADAANPLVTAIIPTRNRPELVVRAVRSALCQTYFNLEVVVVVDGPDPATVAALEALDDSRLRVVALSENVGGSEARNVGGREAMGEWIALLDDDDEWLPEKTQRQVKSILAADCEALFSATQYFDSRDGRSSVQPKLFPSPHQHISEYLFCELDAIGRRSSFLQTSTWMVRRNFFLVHPFALGLKRNQDTDWLLRTFPACKAETVFVFEPLAIFHRQSGLIRISTTRDWEETYRWAQRNKTLFTSRAMAFLLVTQCARNANRQGYGFDTLVSLWGQCDKTVKRSPRLVICFAIALLHQAALWFRSSRIWGGKSQANES